MISWFNCFLGCMLVFKLYGQLFTVFCFILQQPDSVLYESLRKLQLLALTVDLLKVCIESSMGLPISLLCVSCSLMYSI